MNLQIAKQRVLRNRVVRAGVRAFLPVVPRSDLVRFGTVYGGWWIPTALVPHHAVVYSVGVGGDASFDLAMIERFGCEVYGFDPTPFSIDYVASRPWPPQWHFTPVGVWTEQADLAFEPPAGQRQGSASITRPGNRGAAFNAHVESLPQLMRANGHDVVDVLKMDIEGAEGPVLEALLRSSFRPTVLCVEYDQPEAPWRLVSRIKRLLDDGYTLNHVEGWNYTFSREQERR